MTMEARFRRRTREKEEDVAAIVLDASSIPSMQMKRTTLRTSWHPWVGARVTR
jgi:hypothetical protein